MKKQLCPDMSKRNIWIKYSSISVHKEILLISGCFLKLLLYFQNYSSTISHGSACKIYRHYFVKLLLNFKLLMQSANKYMAVIESKAGRNGSDSGIR